MYPTANNLKVRNWVFSIPKRLRIYFLFIRKLLARLSICAWKVIKVYLKAIVSDGCFQDNGTAKVVYTSKDRKFRKIFNALDWLARLVTHIPGRTGIG